MALSTRNSTHRGSHNRGVAWGQSNHAGPSDWLPVSLVPALFKEHMWTRPEEVTAGTLKPEEFSKRLLAAAFSRQKYYFSSVINSWQHAILNSQSLTGHFSSRFRSQSFLPPSSATPNLPPPHLSKLPPSQPSSLWSISHAHIPPSLLPPSLPPSLPLHLTSPHSAFEGSRRRIKSTSLTSSFWASSWVSFASRRCAAFFWARESMDARLRLQTHAQNVRIQTDGWECVLDLTLNKRRKKNSQQSISHCKQNTHKKKKNTKKKTEQKKRKINNSVSNWKKI